MRNSRMVGSPCDRMRRLLACVLPCLVSLFCLFGSTASAYIEVPLSLGKIVADSTNILVMRVESVDRTKNLIVYRKVRDLKGTHPTDVVKHNIGRGGFAPREWQNIMAWAEVGKTAVFFHNGSASETFIDNYWYQAYPGDWWAMTHAEPFLLRSFAGRPEKLAEAVAAILANREVAVTCMVDGDKNALQLRNARIQRMKASLAIQDYDPKRDFIGWGAEEFRPVTSMPGFSLYSPLTRVDPGAAGIAPADFDGDGKPDICLFGPSRAVLLQNGGAVLNEVAIGLNWGARSADWADANGDRRPDLLLATPLGLRLFLNEGEGKFRDASAAVPCEGYPHVTAAAWIDADCDGRPDILVADGFRGLLLYRNTFGEKAQAAAPRIGKWFYIGPFDNPEQRGFAIQYPPEKEIDLSKQYAGKNGEKVAWREGHFTDGQINSLLLFGVAGNENSVVYLYREFDFGGAVELPVSLGSDDTLTVWLNGAQLLAENIYRGCAPDQAQLKLQLRPGKNQLLLKVCQGVGDFAFYFAMPKDIAAPVPRMFEEASEKFGLGAGSPWAAAKGYHIAVADVNADGRPDFLFSAGSGILGMNTPRGFVAARDSGISFQPGGVVPAFGDWTGDGRVDLFVPQAGRSRLFRNDGRGRFVDVTARSGALAASLGNATCAAWTDFQNRGRLDLFVGCLKGPNRFFRNNGDGTFTDATRDVGFHQRIFNTRAIAALDLNEDGVADLIMNNEGQESSVLIGDPARTSSGLADGRR